MRVHLGTDHAGLELKDTLAAWLAENGYEPVDHGAHELDPDDDYPPFCIAAAQAGKGVEFSLALLKAYWADGQNPSQPEVVAAIAASVGLDGAALLAATQDAAVKDILRANTEEAVKRGAFGAPTFYVGEQMFWGNDRLGLLEAFLKGEIA